MHKLSEMPPVTFNRKHYSLQVGPTADQPSTVAADKPNQSNTHDEIEKSSARIQRTFYSGMACAATMGIFARLQMKSIPNDIIVWTSVFFAGFQVFQFVILSVRLCSNCPKCYSYSYMIVFFHLTIFAFSFFYVWALFDSTNSCKDNACQGSNALDNVNSINPEE